MMIASEPVEVPDFIAIFETYLGKLGEGKNESTIEQIAPHIERANINWELIKEKIISDPNGSIQVSTESGEAVKSTDTDFAAAVEGLSGNLLEIFNLTSGTEQLQATPPVYGSKNKAGFGSFVKAAILSKNGAPVGSSASTANDPPTYTVLRHRIKGTMTAYRRAHLLQKAYGSGSDWHNLTAASESFNRSHADREKPILDFVSSGGVVSYAAKVQYGEENPITNEEESKIKSPKREIVVDETWVLRAEKSVPTQIEIEVKDLTKRPRTGSEPVPPELIIDGENVTTNGYTKEWKGDQILPTGTTINPNYLFESSSRGSRNAVSVEGLGEIFQPGYSLNTNDFLFKLEQEEISLRSAIGNIMFKNGNHFEGEHKTITDMILRRGSGDIIDRLHSFLGSDDFQEVASKSDMQAHRVIINFVEAVKGLNNDPTLGDFDIGNERRMEDYQELIERFDSNNSARQRLFDVDGTEIKKLVRAAGTQKAMAAIIGADPGNFSKALSGNPTMVSIETTLKLVEELGIADRYDIGRLPQWAQDLGIKLG
jgi:hypothetical protein